MSVIPRAASASIRRGSRRSAASHSCHSSGVRLGWMPSSASHETRAVVAQRHDGAVRRAVVAVPAHDDRLARRGRNALHRLLELDRREPPALADAVVAPQDRGRLPELVGGEGVERVHGRHPHTSEDSRMSSPRVRSSSAIVSGGSSRMTLL